MRKLREVSSAISTCASIAGGVVLHFLDFFRASEFMDAFTAKGRHTDYMQRMTVQVITHPNPGLLGAAVAVRD